MQNQIQNLQVVDFTDLLFDTFLELHGDRRSGEDDTVICGLARLGECKIVFIGCQRDRASEPPKTIGPAGYRKCLRLINLAEQFKKPVVVFIDIPTTLSLSIAKQQQISAATMSYLEKMSHLAIPTIGVIMNESSGLKAIDMCAMDRILMLENSDWITALHSLPRDDGLMIGDDKDVHPHFSARELLEMNLIHRIISISLNDNVESLVNKLREIILEELYQLSQIPIEVLIQQRLHKLQYQFQNLDVFKLYSSMINPKGQ